MLLKQAEYFEKRIDDKINKGLINKEECEQLIYKLEELIKRLKFENKEECIATLMLAQYNLELTLTGFIEDKLLIIKTTYISKNIVAY